MYCHAASERVSHQEQSPVRRAPRRPGGGGSVAGEAVRRGAGSSGAAGGGTACGAAAAGWRHLRRGGIRRRGIRELGAPWRIASRRTGGTSAAPCTARPWRRTRGSGRCASGRRSSRTAAECWGACGARRGAGGHGWRPEEGGGGVEPGGARGTRVAAASGPAVHWSGAGGAHRRWAWISISRRSWCSTPALLSWLL